MWHLNTAFGQDIETIYIDESLCESVQHCDISCEDGALGQNEEANFVDVSLSESLHSCVISDGDEFNNSLQLITENVSWGQHSNKFCGAVLKLSFKHTSDDTNKILSFFR